MHLPVFLIDTLLLAASRAEERDASKLPELEAAFFDKLQWFEDALKRHADGPYLMGKQFTVADIMSISFMERLGASEWLQFRA